MTDQKPHIPSPETAESCFLGGAAGEFLPEGWHAFLAQVKAEAWDEGHTEGRADEMHGGFPNPYRDTETGDRA